MAHFVYSCAYYNLRPRKVQLACNRLNVLNSQHVFDHLHSSFFTSTWADSSNLLTDFLAAGRLTWLSLLVLPVANKRVVGNEFVYIMCFTLFHFFTVYLLLVILCQHPKMFFFSLDEYISVRHKESLRRVGNADQLAEVDMDAALDLLAEQDKWELCLEKAKTHGGQKSALFHKYMAMYAAHLLKDGKALDALKLYKVNGIQANPQYFDIYQKIVIGIFAMPGLIGLKTYSIWADVRDFLLKLSDGMHKDDDLGEEIRAKFEGYLLASHYLAMHAAFSSLDPPKFSDLISKLSVSLLRHTNVIPTDKAFYIAGMDAKAAGKESLAFVLLNHYLDVVEAMEEERENIEENPNSTEPVEPWRRSSRPVILDNSDFEETDIPLDAPLPLNTYLDPATHEEVKEWVLAVSVDQRVEQVLPVDKRGVFEGSLLSPDGKVCIPCAVSGYPLIGMLADGPKLSSGMRENNVVEFSREGKCALREDWNKLTVAAKSSGEDASLLRDSIRFIGEWCGGVRGAASGDTGFHF